MSVCLIFILFHKHSKIRKQLYLLSLAIGIWTICLTYIFILKLLCLFVGISKNSEISQKSRILWQFLIISKCLGSGVYWNVTLEMFQECIVLQVKPLVRTLILTKNAFAIHVMSGKNMFWKVQNHPCISVRKAGQNNPLFCENNILCHCFNWIFIY